MDPTLDQLLERLEREPDLNALLGIPNRPRNLRRHVRLFHFAGWTMCLCPMP